MSTTNNEEGIHDFSISICFDTSPHMKAKRDRKGNSTITFVCDYVAIDIETTGLDPEYDEIIEIAAARVKSGIVVDTFQTLVKPQYEIDEFITKLTGITNDMLVTAPDVSLVLADLALFLGRSILVGHKVSFDVNFLYDAFRDFNGYGLTNDFIDTCRLWRLIESDLPHHRLIDAITRYGLGSTVEHRALSDTLQVQRFYEALKKKCRDDGIDICSL